MVTVRTLSGDEFSPDLPGRLLKIAGDIRAAGGDIDGTVVTV